MKIKWLGHSCFLLTSADGIRILADPFNEEVGYKIPAVEADIVTVSHDHYDHNSVHVVKGNFTQIRQAGEHTVKGIEIKGVSSFHDDAQGGQRGKNMVFTCNIDGINVCHCGDLGHILSAEQVKEIGAVDVLLVPVGGFYTIDHEQALRIMQLLKPVVTIPMHYKTEVVSYPIAGLDKFLSVAGSHKTSGLQEIELFKEHLDAMAGVVVLEYK
jgi:L-ascorbate metabolism protein UlaG (beta-lactamase superfamily)